LRALGNGSIGFGEPRSGDRDFVIPLVTSDRCRPSGARLP